MDEGHLLMSAKERRRKSVLERVASGQWGLAQAAEGLRLSYCRRPEAAPPAAQGVSHGRERKARFGEIVQLDGSPHAWFGTERPRACLMHLVDDATGVSMALMAEEETTEAAFRLLWKWVERYGVPCVLHLDRKSVYLAQRAPTLEEQLAGEMPCTAFGLACKKPRIELITAHSPKAKGRVERSLGVYQDTTNGIERAEAMR